MSGIYLHIPFCNSKCSYCDFYSVLSLSKKQDLVESMAKELKIRSSFLEGESVKTIYFGGGTPSLLSVSELEFLIETMRQYYSFETDIEFTFEANPEHITKDYLQAIQDLGVNRLSLGVQSFDNAILDFLKRSHKEDQAQKAIEWAFSSGLTNISIDLIYGIPNMSFSLWERQLEKALSYPIKHLSAYHLTYEEATPLYKRLVRKDFVPLSEAESERQFYHLFDYTQKNNFPYYEISNFAREGFHSQHNSSYWLQKKYLGIGPSAHSFNGKIRSWNHSSIKQYMKLIGEKGQAFEEEHLSSLDRLNEYIITQLRTRWGLDLELFKHQFGVNYYKALLQKSQMFIQAGDMRNEQDKLLLNYQGLLKSDLIMETLFFLETEEAIKGKKEK